MLTPTITARSTTLEKKYIETIHPDLENGKRSSDKGNDDDSRSTEGYSVGRTLEFDYEFDRRGYDFGYVQADIRNWTNPDARNSALDRVKLSFVGNSGIKFQEGSGPEVSVFDTQGMIDLAGGIGAFDYSVGSPTGHKGLNADGIVDIANNFRGISHDFEDEPLSRLLNGVVYGGQYSKMADTSFLTPSTTNAFKSALSQNSGRIGRMTIETSASTGLTVKIGNAVVYRDVTNVSELGYFLVQTHWASGVRFKNMRVT
jgi:hypothetical protein